MNKNSKKIIITIAITSLILGSYVNARNFYYDYINQSFNVAGGLELGGSGVLSGGIGRIVSSQNLEILSSQGIDITSDSSEVRFIASAGDSLISQGNLLGIGGAPNEALTVYGTLRASNGNEYFESYIEPSAGTGASIYNAVGDGFLNFTINDTNQLQVDSNGDLIVRGDLKFDSTSDGVANQTAATSSWIISEGFTDRALDVSLSSVQGSRPSGWEDLDDDDIDTVRGQVWLPSSSSLLVEGGRLVYPEEPTLFVEAAGSQNTSIGTDNSVEYNYTAGKMTACFITGVTMNDIERDADEDGRCDLTHDAINLQWTLRARKTLSGFPGYVACEARCIEFQDTHMQ